MLNRERTACCDKALRLLERSYHGVIVVSTENRVEYVNPAAEEILGSTADRLLGTTNTLPVEPGRLHEVRTATQNGREVVLETWAVETEWEKQPAWVVSLQDVTERKRTEQELKKMYRAVVGSPVMVVITDAAGNIEFVNPKVTEVAGYDADEIIGRNLWEKKELETSSECCRAIRETVLAGREWRGEILSRRKNGETYYQSLSIAPIEGPDGAITNFVAIIEDVSERKRYEEQLRSSERQLAEAQKIAHLGSWKRYLDTGRSFWSDELYRILGHEPGSVLPSHESFLAMVHPEDREHVLQFGTHSSGNHTSYSEHYCRIVRPDGSIRILLSRAEVVVDGAGTPFMVIGTALDVTEIKSMEEEIRSLNGKLEARAADLEAANRELESFSYTVCHDLRAPLTNINGYCQVLAEMCSEQLDDQCRGYLGEITKGTLRMNELIDTLLNFSLITRVAIERTEVDLSDMAWEAVRGLQFEQPERQVEVNIQEGMVVTGDERLMRVVVQNLIGNAWKYTAEREKAVIEFGCSEKGGERGYFVRDNGIGFRAREARKLFAPFQRLPETGNIKGHGIGLATVQRIIERHGGRVWAEGKPGQGATFSFTLSGGC